jgi:hypothetical protein
MSEGDSPPEEDSQSQEEDSQSEQRGSSSDEQEDWVSASSRAGGWQRVWHTPSRDGCRHCRCHRLTASPLPLLCAAATICTAAPLLPSLRRRLFGAGRRV